MSLENVKEYVRRCVTEPELRDKARAIGLTDADEHMRHAKSLGLEWTRRDMVNFRNEVVGPDDDLADMSDEELEMVAGGVCTTTAVVVSGVVAGAVAGTVAAGAAGAAVGGGAAAAGGGGW